MAKGEYALEIKPKLQKARDAFEELAKAVEHMGGTVKKTGTQAGVMSAKFLSLGTVLVGTASTVAFIGAAIEKSMFQSRIAIERTGASADRLAAQIQGASRSAAALIPVGAQFSQLNFAADQLEAVTDIAFQFSRSMGISEKEAGAALSGIAAAAGLKTAPQIRQLASGIAAANKAFPDFSKGNIEMLRTLAPTASQMGVTADALMAANIAFQRVGISSGQAQTAISEMLENFRFGPKQITAFATALGLPRHEIARFQDLDPTSQFREMFKVMREGGMVTRRNVPMLMKYLNVSSGTADAMIRLAKSGKDTNEIFKLLNVETAKGTFVLEDYERWAATLHGSLDTLWQLLRSVAETTAPLLTAALYGIVKVFTAIVWVVSLIPGPLRGVIVGFTALAGVMMLVSKVMSSQFVASMLTGIKTMTSLTIALLSGDVATRKQIMSQMGLTVARFADIKATVAQIAKNLLLITGHAIALPFLIIAKVLTLALAGAKWVLTKAIHGSGLVTAMLMETATRGKNIASMVLEKVAIVASVIAKGAYSAATWIASAATGVFTGVLGFVTAAAGFAAGAFTALAVAVWAALAPLLPFIAIGAAIVAVVVGIYFVVKKLISWYNKATGAAKGLALGLIALVPVVGPVIAAFLFLRDNWQKVVDVAIGFWNVLKSIVSVIGTVAAAIWEGLITPIKFLWNLLGAAGKAIVAPFKMLWNVLSGIGGFFSGIFDSLFGSSLFHLKEGVAEVMPALGQMENAFAGVGRAAQRVGIEAGIPDDIRVRIAEPMGRIGVGRVSGLSDVMEGRQAFGGPAGSGAETGITKPSATRGAAGAGEGVAGGGGGRIVVPVTINLDGETIGRVVQEYELNAGRERYMNASAEVLRGTGG